MKNISRLYQQYKSGIIIGILVIIIAIIWGLMRFSSSSAPSSTQAIPVTIEKVQQKTVNIDLTEVGKVYPYSTVAIRSQVEGPIVKIDFKRGQDVKVGDILFSIDPRPYEVALQQTQANLAKEQALLHKIESDHQRMQILLKKGVISQENYDQVYSDMLAQQATVHGAQASVAHAQLQLDYCTIRSPIDGRAGDILVNLGNLVKANDTQPLVIINQLSPIFVSFDVPEKFLPAINRRMAQGKVSITVKGTSGEILSDKGELFFIDNTIDPLTGTIELKANFDNENQELWPGQFVNVVLDLATIENALLIPTRAIQQGQKGSYVYIITNDNKAEYRTVQVGQAIGDNSIITEGLTANEQVVVNGQFRLTSGSEVKISSSESAQ